jgi:WD repeat-containing protein 35
MGQDAMKSGRDPTTIKKFFVLAALEVERHFSIQRNANNDVTSALSNLLFIEETNDSASKEFYNLESPWRAAEAYHFYTLAQRQFYTGQLSSAVITSCKLKEYEDILGETTVYSLIALISLHAEYYETCSKAFLKLESLEDANMKQYQNLAFEIFTRNKPVDPDLDDIIVCSNCLGQIKEK